MTPKNENARGEAGVHVSIGGQAEATYQSKHTQSSTAPDVLESKSTATEVQLAKTLALLRIGPKTTIQLRDHGIMMPAPRIHHLRHVDGHTIASESVTLYDANGFRHSKCARYHLVREAPQQIELPGVPHE
jgi:hypothetical protein